MSLEELRTALRLDDETLTQWVGSLRNPEGEIVDRTNVYKAIKYGSPEWLADEVVKKIQQSRKDFPGYYRRLEKQKAS